VSVKTSIRLRCLPRYREMGKAQFGGGDNEYSPGVGLRTIAKGLETVVQCDFITAQGCDLPQGRVPGRPTRLGQLFETMATADGVQRELSR